MLHILAWLREIECIMKTDPDVYELAHASLEERRGEPYKKQKCSYCPWSCDSLTLLKRQRKALLEKPTAEQKLIQKEHMSLHFMKLLFVEPVTDIPVNHCWPDLLHLVKMNTFKQKFEGTVYMQLSDEMMVVCQDYLVLAGFPVRVRKQEGEPPCASWIGRDCDKFVGEADLHLPHLLHLAFAPESAGPKARAILDEAAKIVKRKESSGEGSSVEGSSGNAEDDDDDDWDQEFEPTPKEAQAQEEEPLTIVEAAKV